MGKPVAGGIVCYSCEKAGHLRRDCCAGAGLGAGNRPPFRCCGCGGVGYGISFCPERALPSVNVAGIPFSAAGSGNACWGVKRGGGHLAGSGFRGRSLGGGSVLGYLGGGAGRVAVTPQSARA